MGAPALPGWEQHILQGVGAPVTPANLKFFNAWAQAEGGNASNNPFNTTQPASGATSYNSNGGNPVKNYMTPQQGIQATIETLNNGHYGNILAALRRGTDPVAAAQALAQSPWGTGSGALRVLGAPGVSGPANAAWGTPGTKGKPGQGQSGLPPMPTPGAAQLLRQVLSRQMMSQAAATISGGGPKMDSNSMMQMALLRQQLSAAQDTYGQMFNPNTPQQQAPTAHGGWAGKSLDGNIPMVVGGKSPFSNLKFQNHVDWQHVNPRLLKTINDIASQHGVVATINSGYRDSHYSAANGGFSGDPHTKGLAVDAYVNGKPIGDVFGANVWSHYGVRSGNVPNFYKGQPDPEHLDLLSS